MKKLTVLVLIFFFLLSTGAVNETKSQSSWKVFINADGSVQGTDRIQRNGNLYTVTGDLYNSPIIVECNHIILDGGGFTLHGYGAGWVSGAVAVNLTATDVTVKNFKIVGFWEVGVLGAWNGNTVMNCNITGTDRAVSIYADDYVVTGNYLADNHVGIRMRGVRGTFTENIIVDNVDGIDITGTNGSLIIGNQFESNMMAIVTDHGGFQLYHNNFINQTVRWDGAYSATVLLASHSSNDTFLTWDNGFPSGGNYWSDYTARYPNATEIDSLEIGDTTYVIGMHYAINSTKVNTYIVQAVDRYPLLTPVDIPKATTAMPSRSPSATPTLNQSQPPTPSQSTPPQPTHTPSPSYTLQLTAPPNEEMELAPEYIFALAGVGMAVAAAIVALLKRKQQ